MDERGNTWSAILQSHLFTPLIFEDSTAEQKWEKSARDPLEKQSQLFESARKLMDSGQNQPFRHASVRFRATFSLPSTPVSRRRT